MAEEQYVVDKALMQCNQGTIPMMLTVTSNPMVNVAGMKVATGADKMPMVNVPPFGICGILTKTNPMPCTPTLVQWSPLKYDLKVNNNSPLLSNSCAQCSIGGKVEFLSSGQIPLPPKVLADIENAQRETEALLDLAAKEEHAIGESGLAEGLIPLWGSGRDFIHFLQTGQYGWMALSAGFFVWDAISVAAGIVSFGAATAAMMAGKATVVAAIKAGGKVIAKATAKGIAKSKAAGRAIAETVAEVAVKAADNLKDLAKTAVTATGEMVAFVKGAVKTGAKINLRKEYTNKVLELENIAIRLLQSNMAVEDVAKKVFEMRRKLTIEYKHMTPDDLQEVIFRFNNERYTKKGLGDKWGLTWEGALKKYSKNGKIDHESIIKGASKNLGTKDQVGAAIYRALGDNVLPILEKYKMTGGIPK